MTTHYDRMMSKKATTKPADPRSVQRALRLTPTEAEAHDRAAAAMGHDWSGWARWILNAAAAGKVSIVALVLAGCGEVDPGELAGAAGASSAGAPGHAGASSAGQGGALAGAAGNAGQGGASSAGQGGELPGAAGAPSAGGAPSAPDPGPYGWNCTDPAPCGTSVGDLCFPCQRCAADGCPTSYGTRCGAGQVIGTVGECIGEALEGQALEGQSACEISGLNPTGVSRWYCSAGCDLVGCLVDNG